MISLKVGSRIFEGWTRLRVERGLDRLASVFALEVSDKPWPIRPGDRAEVMIDDELVVTGWVDRVRPSYDATTRTISVGGRSLTGDLVDCTHLFPPNQWFDQRLETIAAAITKPFGIAVRVTASTGDPLTGFGFDSYANIHGELERLARLRALILTDDARGRMVLTRAGKERAPAALQSPGNVLSAQGNFSLNQRFSVYKVIGQQSGSDQVADRDVTAVGAEARDGGVGRYRPLVINPTGPIDAGRARDLVRHEAAVRFGRAAEVVYQVAGWRAGPDKRLWEANQLVAVRDARMRLDRDMLIASVAYQFGEEGETTTLTVVRPEAYNLLAEPVSDVWADVQAPS